MITTDRVQRAAERPQTMRLGLIVALALGLSACVAESDAPTQPAGDAGSTSGGANGNAAAGGGPGAGSGGGATSGSGAGAAGGEDAGAGGSPTDDACPVGMVCVTTFPFVDVGTTLGASSDQFDAYGCGSQDESGPEVIYRVDVPSEGFLWLELPEGDMAPGVDIDVHLLASLDANDCLDRGHFNVGELLPAGRYYVTADTWVSDEGVAAAGDYTLELGLVTVQDLQSWGISAAVASDALRVFDQAWTRGDVDTSAYAVVDFGLHASERRMWIFDAFEASLRHQTFTSVGAASDPDADGWADAFSNISGSHQSSLGLMKGAEAYVGTYGESVRLDGLETGYNDGVRNRAIVLHPWNGSTQAYVDANPSTGAAPTWGCLGVDPAIVVDVRDFLAGGGLLLSHFPDGNWSAQSSYLP